MADALVHPVGSSAVASCRLRPDAGPLCSLGTALGLLCVQQVQVAGESQQLGRNLAALMGGRGFEAAADRAPTLKTSCQLGGQTTFVAGCCAQYFRSS